MTVGNANIWDRLREVRACWGITQAEMASRMGVSLRAYQNYETNERGPKASDVAGLALLGVDLNWLLAGIGQMLRDTSSLSSDPIDEQLLADVLQLVDDWLSANRRTMPPARKAEVAASIYAMAVEDVADGKAPVDQRRVAQILKLVV